MTPFRLPNRQNFEIQDPRADEKVSCGGQPRVEATSTEIEPNYQKSANSSLQVFENNFGPGFDWKIPITSIPKFLRRAPPPSILKFLRRRKSSPESPIKNLAIATPFKPPKEKESNLKKNGCRGHERDPPAALASTLSPSLQPGGYCTGLRPSVLGAL